jgi:hypothetical protein
MWGVETRVLAYRCINVTRSQRSFLQNNSRISNYPHPLINVYGASKGPLVRVEEVGPGETMWRREKLWMMIGQSAQDGLRVLHSRRHPDGPVPLSDCP